MIVGDDMRDNMRGRSGSQSATLHGLESGARSVEVELL